MTSINTNYKANSVDPATQSGSMDPYLAEIQAQIQEALSEIELFKLENSEWLTEEQLAQMNRIEVTLKAEAAAIQGGGLGGAGAVPGAVDENGNLLNRPEELPPEWGGIPSEYINGSDPYGQDLINDDPSKYGDFAGTITIPNSGDPNIPTNISFQMTDDMTEIYGESRGRDLIVTVVFEDGSKKSWVIEEGTVRPEPIVFSALGLTHGVKMDFSRVIRIDTGDYACNSEHAYRIYMHGSEYDDVLIGTQSERGDKIVGYAGNDTIDGMAGNDLIWGDEHYEASGQHSIEYGGDDTIKGGTGYDTIYGGGGIDTPYASDKGESVFETEKDPIEDVADATTIPDPDDWFYSSGSPESDWVADPEIEDGMVVIYNESGNAGELNIDMPQGYNMAYAEQDGDNNLIITFVGEDGTFKIMIEDFFGKFDDDAVRLHFFGGADNDIIDFSRVELTSQAISIEDAYNSDDIILGAKSALLSDGVELDSLLESQKNSDNALQNYVDEGAFATDEANYTDPSSADGYHAEVDETNNQIHISGDTDHSGKLNIKAPDGYDVGYMTMHGGDMYLILVKRSESGKAQTMVFRIDGSLGLDFSDISVSHAITEDGEPTFGGPIPLYAISDDIDDYLIDAGPGNDIVFSQKGGNTKNAEDEVEVQPDSEIPPTPPSGGSGSGGTGEVGGGDEPGDTDPGDTDPGDTDPGDTDPDTTT